MSDLTRYADLPAEVKTRVAGAQVRAALAANHELRRLNWDIGRMIDARRRAEGWGARVIPSLAVDLARELPSAKGFSERNLKRMVPCFHAYPVLAGVAPCATQSRPQAVAQLANPEADARNSATRDVEAPTEARTAPHSPAPSDPAELCAHRSLNLPWGHNILLLQKTADLQTRTWHMQRCSDEGWSRDVLDLQIKSHAHTRQGAAVTNFAERLPPTQSNLAQQAIKDPYVFDFLTLDAPFRQRELDAHLLLQLLERSLLELGVGFALVGRQHRLTLGDDDFYLDLLFYHLKLRCFVVVDLKIGAFKAEYAGKMNLYLNLVDDTLRHPSDQPSIGLILCQDNKRLLAEYALRGIDKPIGVSEYELTRALPSELASALPTVQEIEAELADDEVEP